MVLHISGAFRPSPNTLKRMDMSGRKSYSKDSRINLVIENILDQLCPFLEEQAQEISEMTAIGKALGTGQDIGTLLEMILSIARRFSRADGGTLYLVDSTARFLEFHVLHNESLDIKQEGDQINLPNVMLYNRDGSPNLANVCAYVFHTGEIVNIKDVYETEKFHFDGTKKFDRTLNYRSRSMVVIPMRNHENDIIGILQLINAQDIAKNRITAFTSEAQEKAVALASQAAVILTQQMLILEMKELFEAFIRAIAVSIDEKSKHTGGHIQRVTELALMIAEKINQDDTVFKDTLLSQDQIDELRIAALMHDTGKITTPDHIIGKSSRLETVFDRIELIRTRLELFKTHEKLAAAEKKLALFEAASRKTQMDAIDAACDHQIGSIDNDMDFLTRINANRSGLTADQTRRLGEIKTKQYRLDSEKIPYLTPDEAENISIERGTLTPQERDTINNHAYLTEKILNKLPWPKKLARIPAIAGAHHEKLDGSGYPLQLTGDQLNIQARILAVADIFEALSAADRPYKNPMALSQTLDVLEHLARDNKIDGNIVALFINTKLYRDYAKKHLSSTQIDL
jgi:HD-GYP domain-containing protein (c-di-GMP phosphodiesterase class II)